MSDQNEETVLVTKSGFTAPETLAFLPAVSVPDVAIGAATHIDVDPDTDIEPLLPRLSEIQVIRIGFPTFSDGRGLTLARQLRRVGYKGTLRAHGHMISDQFRLALECGFDEAEIHSSLAARQPEAQWRLDEIPKAGYLARLR